MEQSLDESSDEMAGDEKTEMAGDEKTGLFVPAISSLTFKLNNDVTSGQHKNEFYNL